MEFYISLFFTPWVFCYSVVTYFFEWENLTTQKKIQNMNCYCAKTYIAINKNSLLSIAKKEKIVNIY
jgi:hypothetical protein